MNETYGGTSLASPIVAAQIAIVQQSTHTPIGFANPTLYAREAGRCRAFRDVLPQNPTQAVAYTSATSGNTLPGHARPGHLAEDGEGLRRRHRPRRRVVQPAVAWWRRAGTSRPAPPTDRPVAPGFGRPWLRRSPAASVGLGRRGPMTVRIRPAEAGDAAALAAVAAVTFPLACPPHTTEEAKAAVHRDGAVGGAVRGVPRRPGPRAAHRRETRTAYGDRLHDGEPRRAGRCGRAGAPSASGRRSS